MQLSVYRASLPSCHVCCAWRQLVVGPGEVVSAAHGKQAVSEGWRKEKES